MGKGRTRGQKGRKKTALRYSAFIRFFLSFLLFIFLFLVLLPFQPVSVHLPVHRAGVPGRQGGAGTWLAAGGARLCLLHRLVHDRHHVSPPSG